MSFPRRMSLNLMTSAELAIYNAIQEIEKIGADVRLTDAVNMLSKAKDLVSDFIDGVKPNPTAVNGDEVKGSDLAIREDIANILRDNITFAPQVEKIIQYFSKLEPKAAAPKADVKSAEYFYNKWIGHNAEMLYLPAPKRDVISAMEEYANQFKSQPQEKTFTLQDMLDYGKWMRDQLFKYEDGVPEVDYLKEKHGIDLNMIQ